MFVVLGNLGELNPLKIAGLIAKPMFTSNKLNRIHICVL